MDNDMHTEAERRLSVGGSTIRYRTNRITLSTSEITTIKINSDQEDGIYYVGEDALLKADFENPSAVLYFKWQKETDEKSHDIDMASSKYTGSSCRPGIGRPLLVIRKCSFSDAGTYTLMVSCKDVDIHSNEIHLKVKQGPPEVTLHKVPSVLLNEFVKFKATIRGFPKNYKVDWMKGGQYINTTDPKYMGSMINGSKSVLCIRNVGNDDNAVYTVRVANTCGVGESSERLEVIEVSQMFFMSGPVVVSPSETITFQSCQCNQDLSNIKWWMIKDHSIKEIKPDNTKYLYQKKDNIQRFEITIAEKDDSATYQFSLNNMRSNKISVHVDDSEKFSNQGNCLRFFALQAVSADAMRKVCNSKFDKFEETIHKIIDDCESNQHIRRKKELLLRLKTKERKCLEDVDISLMYAILKEEKTFTIPKNGWGKRPKESDIDEADDIERIRYYRNLICHLDASNMETSTFNESVLDLLGAIRRLSKDNANLIKRSCDILNEVFTDSEGIQMMDELESFRQEKKKWDHLLHNQEFLAAVQKIQRNIQYTDVIFHDVCDEGIQISENGTRATQDILYRGYVCFMNRPLKPGDEVHLRGEHIENNLKYYKERANIKIGLTNSAPSRNSINSGIVFREVTCVQEKCPGKCFERFHLRIKLHDSVGCALMTSLNDTVRDTCVYPTLAAIGPFWLAINPYGIKSIKISNI